MVGRCFIAVLFGGSSGNSTVLILESKVNLSEHETGQEGQWINDIKEWINVNIARSKEVQKT